LRLCGRATGCFKATAAVAFVMHVVPMCFFFRPMPAAQTETVFSWAGCGIRKQLVTLSDQVTGFSSRASSEVEQGNGSGCTPTEQWAGATLFGPGLVRPVFGPARIASELQLYLTFSIFTLLLLLFQKRKSKGTLVGIQCLL
jgi:hypothetical protein